MFKSFLKGMGRVLNIWPRNISAYGSDYYNKKEFNEENGRNMILKC